MTDKKEFFDVLDEYYSSTSITSNNVNITTANVDNDPTIYLTEDVVFTIGPDFSITGKDLKILLKRLNDVNKKNNPEDYI